MTYIIIYNCYPENVYKITWVNLGKLLGIELQIEIELILS